MAEAQNAIFKKVFEAELSPRQSRKLLIAESAIQHYATIGFERTTFEIISKGSGVSRPLVHRYFKDRREVFKLSLKFIRTHMQESVIREISKHTTSKHQLRAYIKSSFKWVKDNPTYAQTWILFFYYSSIEPEFNDMMLNFTKMGQHRITALIKKGVAEKDFICDSPELTAKWIQVNITGSVLSLTAENKKYPIRKLETLVVDQAFKSLGCKPPK